MPTRTQNTCTHSHTLARSHKHLYVCTLRALAAEKQAQMGNGTAHTSNIHNNSSDGGRSNQGGRVESLRLNRGHRGGRQNAHV